MEIGVGENVGVVRTSLRTVILIRVKGSLYYDRVSY